MTKGKQLALSGLLCAVAVVIACMVVWRETAGAGTGAVTPRTSAMGGATPNGEQVAGTLVRTTY